MITSARQISPEEWSPINQTVPNKHQAAIPINFDMSLALGPGQELLGRLCLLFPHQDLPAQRAGSPGVLMSVLLVCCSEMEGGFKEASRQRGR